MAGPEHISETIKIFQDFLMVLGISVGIIWGLRKLHLPPILGYLLAGTMVGPYGFELMRSQESLTFVAEFGVAFLLFAIGLELSFPKLIAMRRKLIGLGGMQVAICTVIVIGIAHFAGLDWPAAIAVAGALSLSSTAVVIKQLIEQNELHAEHGKLSLSILLFQDLAAVPFLIIVPAMDPSGDSSISETLLHALLMGGIVFIGMLAAGRWLLRPLFHNIAHTKSTELFMLTGLLVVLVSAFITHHVGLSLVLGAFLAGVMLAETEYVHQIEADIQPFRDILLGLFFITVGMKLDPQILMTQWPWILGIVAGIIVFKTIIIATLSKMAGASNAGSIKAGLALAQGGEFGFALLAIAANRNLIESIPNQIVIASILISIAISPLLIRNANKICAKILPDSDSLGEDLPTMASSDSHHAENHVIICGYGRVGQTLARFLEYEGIPFVGLDMDPIRLKEARAANEPIFYGDSADDLVLKAAGIEKARLLIIAFDDVAQSQKCLHVVRRLNREIPILVRTTDDRHLEQLQIAGATEVISDKLESSLMLASHMLMLMGTSPEKAQQQVWEVKTNRYKMLQAYYSGQEDHQHLESIEDTQQTLHAVELTEGAYAVGKTLEEFMTEKMPLQLASFSRSGFKCDAPAPHTILEPGDVVVIIGTIDELYLAEEKLLQG